jgi:hypothetical protein
MGTGNVFWCYSYGYDNGICLETHLGRSRWTDLLVKQNLQDPASSTLVPSVRIVHWLLKIHISKFRCHVFHFPRMSRTRIPHLIKYENRSFVGDSDVNFMDHVIV